MLWQKIFQRTRLQSQTLLREIFSDLNLLADLSQVNRRTRAAWLSGRTTRACYLWADHQRRRMTRRREIRQLVEGEPMVR